MAELRLDADLVVLSACETATGKVGAVGFCWGGGAVNDLSCGDLLSYKGIE